MSWPWLVGWRLIEGRVIGGFNGMQLIARGTDRTSMLRVSFPLRLPLDKQGHFLTNRILELWVLW